jgi:hypothetical protein
MKYSDHNVLICCFYSFVLKTFVTLLFVVIPFLAFFIPSYIAPFISSLLCRIIYLIINTLISWIQNNISFGLVNISLNNINNYWLEILADSFCKSLTQICFDVPDRVWNNTQNKHVYSKYCYYLRVL